MALTEDAKAEIKAAIAIVREDKHYKMISEIHSRGKVDPKDPPKNDPANPPTDPPPSNGGEGDTPKKKPRGWWDPSLFTDDEPDPKEGDAK